MACIACGRSFHNECEDGCEECHAEQDKKVKAISQSYGTRGQPVKAPEDVTDPYSTGRKRAAIQYPLFRTNPCEWRGKKNVGGGVPIVGCIDGKQEHRHHGPIKNPLRNEPGNVHRICTHCHNRWHTTNDSDYDESLYETLPHDPIKADEIDLIANEAKWRIQSGKNNGS